jgi:hypothetical protein
MSQIRRAGRLTPYSDLSPIILRMIATNSLAAFAQAISPAPPATPVRGPSPTTTGLPQGAASGGLAQGALGQGGLGSGRTLDAVPPPPPRPLPRGSLLDLRV